MGNPPTGAVCRPCENRCYDPPAPPENMRPWTCPKCGRIYLRTPEPAPDPDCG